MCHHFCDVLPKFTEHLLHWEANMRSETTHLHQGKGHNLSLHQLTADSSSVSSNS